MIITAVLDSVAQVIIYDQSQETCTNKARNMLLFQFTEWINYSVIDLILDKFFNQS